jgi:hypothetical protein
MNFEDLDFMQRQADHVQPQYYRERCA